MTSLPAAAGAPLREPVLAGAFFGARHAETASRLAAFLQADGAQALLEWFGAADAMRLGADPEACRARLDRDIAALDALIGAQLDAVLHHPRMRRLEGCWRGLAWLVDAIPPGARIKVRALTVSWAEICRDLERASDFDQSQLFRKIYEEEFGSPGGEPFGLLVVDHEVRHRPAGPAAPDDITGLALLSGVAAAAFSPVVLAASPSLLGADDFADLAMASDIGAALRDGEHARWRSLAGREDMRFVAVALPRLLARPPWADDPARREGFRYAEYAPDAGSRVWMTAGYGFARCVVRAFANHAWPADVRGAETDRDGGGVVTEMPVEPFTTDPDHVWVRSPLDLVLTDRQERALAEAGLMPLSMLPFSEAAVFGAVRSLQAPARHIGPTGAAADANARISTQMNAILCVSRFAHYLKLRGRQMVGLFRNADEIERELQTWLTAYVDANPNSPPESRARFPLVSARVMVRERPGRPGVFGCTMLLQPHFQLDDVSATFRLVTDIVAPARA